MALKLSSTVHGTSTGDRGRRESPATIQDSDVDLDHEIYRKASQFCGHQEVCVEHISPFIHTPKGKLYICLCIHAVCSASELRLRNHGVSVKWCEYT